MICHTCKQKIKDNEDYYYFASFDTYYHIKRDCLLLPSSVIMNLKIEVDAKRKMNSITPIGGKYHDTLKTCVDNLLNNKYTTCKRINDFTDKVDNMEKNLNDKQ